jgi:hypothetical protein
LKKESSGKHRFRKIPPATHLSLKKWRISDIYGIMASNIFVTFHNPLLGYSLGLIFIFLCGVWRALGSSKIFKLSKSKFKSKKKF